MQSNRSASAGVDAAGRSRPLSEQAKAAVQQVLAIRSPAATVKHFATGDCGFTLSSYQADCVRREMKRRGMALWVPPRADEQAPPPRPISTMKSAPIDNREERIRYSEAEDGSRRLLSAQLRTGQHYHTFENAQRIADAIGAPGVLVRPGIGDTAVRA